MPKPLNSLQDVADQYDAFLIDLYGVVHDGRAPYPYSLNALLSLKDAGKHVTFLTNSPNRAALIQSRLKQMKINEAYYDAILPAGEFGIKQLLEGKLSHFPSAPKFFYMAGSNHKETVTEHTPLTQVQRPEEAEFILSTIYNAPYPNEALTEELKTCLALDKPMLCLNPDTYIIRKDGCMEPCAGLVANEYEQMGGKVTYVGKPYAAIYAYAKEQQPSKRFLAIGDNLMTDIKGANAAAIDVLWITNGMHLPELAIDHFEETPSQEAVESLLQTYGVEATYRMNLLR